MNVLLINANSCVSPYPVYPLGLSYVAAATAADGHQVRMLDLNLPDADLDATVRTFAPDCVGLSIRNIDDCHIENTQFLALRDVELALRVRKLTGAPLVLGGSGFSIFPVPLMEATGAEFGVAGAAERAFPELLRNLARPDQWPGIPGLVHRSASGVTVNACAGVSCPALLPRRPEDLVAYYLQASSMLNVQTQRGCAFTCCYCSYPLIEGRSPGLRQAREVAEECAALKSLGARYFFVVDSVLNTTADHVAGICEEMIRCEVGVPWGCFLRPRGLTRDLMNLMARAGLTHVEFGTDSFSDPVLQAYGKGFTFEDVYQSSEMARGAGVHYSHFLIAGGPGETEATLLEGFKNSRRLRTTVVFPFIGMRIYPRTSLWRRAVDEGVVAESADLFEPSFYVSPLVSRQRIRELLLQFSGQVRNWVVGEPSPEVLRITARLRERGTVGPLWEFLAR